MKQIYPIAATSHASAYVLFIPLLILIAALLLYLGYAPKSVRFEIAGGALRIRGDLFYGRTIPLAELQLEHAVATDLTHDPEHQLAFRTNGTGLPGYKGGWFQLKNGQKALVFVTDPHRVVYIPVRAGYVLLLSVSNGDQFLDALKTSLAAQVKT